jgi:membrane-associated protein
MFNELAQFYQNIMNDPTSVFNPEAIIRYGGLSILFLIVFAETGLFFCFFFPGDSLVFTAGVLCATGDLGASWLEVNIVMVSAAILGNMTGFWVGRRSGSFLLNRNDSWYFKKEYIATADSFYKRYGGMALVLGRFLPIVRTFAPIVAGILKLSYRRFLMLTVIGALGWVIPLVTLGYFLGNVSWVKDNLGYIIIAMVVLITTPIILKVVKERRKQHP